MRRVYGVVLGITVGLPACSDTHTRTNSIANGGSSGDAAGGTAGMGGSGAGGSGGSAGTIGTGGMAGNDGGLVDGDGTGGTAGSDADADSASSDRCHTSGEHCMFVAWVTSARGIDLQARDEPGNWSLVRRLTTPTTPSCVSLAVLREDNGGRFLWAFWTTLAGSIDYAWTHDGVTWSAPATAVPEGSTTACPASAGFQPGATGNRIFLVWTAINGSVMFTSNSGEGAFSSPAPIAPAGSTTRGPAIENVIEHDGTVRLWAAWSAADGSLQWARGDGSAWQGRGAAFPAGTSTQAPTLSASTEQGNFYGWIGWRAPDGSIGFAYNNFLNGWEGPIGLRPQGATADVPALEGWRVRSTFGWMWAAWNAGNTIQYSASDGANPFDTPRAVPGASYAVGSPALASFPIP